ncbi:MAG: hypothetical protein HY704_05415 [Gemmatimonadetes bacterium]|nr:hypothetical protein [Gemmatimonadota bacterium]
MQAIGKRLEAALERWPNPPGGKRDKKAFAAAMEARLRGRGGQKGVSYQSILSYLDGTSTPSLEWLGEAADLLNIRPEWLVFGMGLPDETGEAIRRGHEERAREVGETDVEDPLSRAALHGLTETLPLQKHLMSEYRCLVTIAIELAHTLKEISPKSGVESYREAGRLIGRCIAAPLSILPVTIPDDEERMARAYVSAAAHALGIVTHYAGQESSGKAAKATKRKRRSRRKKG